LFPFLSPPSSYPFPYTTLFRSSEVFLWHCLPSTRKEIFPLGCTGRPFRKFWSASAKARPSAALCPVGWTVSTNSRPRPGTWHVRSEEHTSELQSRVDLVCRLLL